MKILTVAESQLSIEYLHGHDKVIYYLGQLIITGQLKNGDPLPSKEAIKNMVGVTLRSLDKALFILELYGVVKRRNLYFYVSHLNAKVMEHIFLCVLRKKPTTFNFMEKSEARLMLELAAVKLAAVNRTSANLEHFKQALQKLETNNLPYDERVDNDLKFHVGIMEASRDIFIKHLYIDMQPHCFRLIDEKKFYRGMNANANTEHRIILEAIIDQDVDAAVKAMEVHLATPHFS